MVHFQSVVDQKGRKEKIILNVFQQLKQDQCHQDKEEQPYQENKELRENQGKGKDQTTQEHEEENLEQK
jgi:hypothetical protein